MSEPIAPQATEFTEALRAWKMRLCEWMGFDPAALSDVDTVEHPYTGPDAALYTGMVQVEVTWRGVADQQTDRGHRGPSAFSGDAEWVEWSGSVWLDWEEARELDEVVGPKPEMFTPEERQRLMHLFERHAE